MEKFTFFWQKETPFSQWKLFDMEINGVIYNSCEQFMMAEKARLFEDYDTEQSIMNAKHPKDQKRLGRTVQNFNKNQWDAVVRNIVYIGNLAKFTQSQDMRRQLLDTINTTLVEASPFDQIWGIGLSANDPLALERATWRGKNWLGEVLTILREDIIAGRERTKEDFIFDLPWSANEN